MKLSQRSKFIKSLWKNDYQDRLIYLDERLSGQINLLDGRLSGQINLLDKKVSGLGKRLENQEFTNRGILIGLIVVVLGGAAKVFGFLPNS